MLSSAKRQSSNPRLSISNKNKLSSISSSQDFQAQKRALITMEEVWKDINHRHNHESRFNPNSIFQDFLNQQPTTMGSSSSNGNTTTVPALFSNSPLAPPATVLSLNSAPGFEFLDNQDPIVASLHSHNHLTNSFEDLVTTSCFGKKRGHEDSNEGLGNRRHKRMIKNRESAARSRARKQAYTNELELEVAHLQTENARLKRQQEKVRMEAANQQPKKKTLRRSSTAPF